MLQSTPAITYGYNTFGLVQSITHNSHQINYQYDTAGRVSATDIDSGNYSLNKYYKDRLEKVQTDGSLTINNSAAANAVFNYNPDGTLESVTYPNNGSNIIKTSYTYNGLNRLISVTNSKDGTPFSQYTYSYDNNGNITSVTDLNGTTSYEYDVLNRLIEVIKGGATTQEYTYDARGNRENQTGVTAETNGNETLSYNLWGQLVSVADSTGTTTFEYSPTGLRVKKGSKNYIYDTSGNLKAEADASNTITATYIWGGDRLLIKKLANGTQYYYIYNGHGDVVQITDNAGNIVNSYEYDEWGNITSQTETIENEFKYAGQIYDSETGLYYLRARYYDPTTGRFISKDSNEGSIVNPLSLNLYTYCVNNPTKYVDPSGCSPYLSYNKLFQNWLADQLRAADAEWQIRWEEVEKASQDIVKFLTIDWDDPNALEIAGLIFKPAKAGKPAIKAIAKVAGKIETKVIGHFPDYINLSKEMGIKPFDIPINVWNKMTPAEQWAANTKFLDRAIAKNSEFVLATPIKEMKPGSYFEREVEYLFSKGYKLSSDGTKLIK